MPCACENKFVELTDYINEVYTPAHPQSSLIAILHRAQGMYGYLSKEVMDHVADLTEVPAAEIYGVATFYSFFKLQPQGRHHVSVCMGTACYIRGAQKVLEAIQDELGVKPGETTGDMLFTLDETRCIGACGLAPVLMVDDKVHGRVIPEQVKGILDSYQEQGEE